ncbi:helix-turn-helix domain-containing protein [Streptomyces sp. NPDC001185]|uniref:helix-turn-helix domain-containing protein n=1 Tax=Streptomyces sp. NPDC001185 TaxID=3154380 RepID=UPI00331E8074
MAELVRVRRLIDQEGQKLSSRSRRAMMLLAWASGNRIPVIAQLVQADEDTVREVIHRFNEIGLACLAPRRAAGRPRQLSTEEGDFVVQTGTIRPTELGQPYHPPVDRQLTVYLRRIHGRVIRIGREAFGCLLPRSSITFERTKTWKETPDPECDAKLDRIDHLRDRFPDRVLAFDEFPPLGIRPTAATPRRPWPCIAPCAGAPTTPATLMYSPPSAGNAPVSAARGHPLGRTTPSPP